MQLTNKTKTKIGLAIAAIVFLTVFIFTNMEVIEVNFLFARVEMRRSVMLLGVFFLGMATGCVIRSLKASHKTPASTPNIASTD